jgi:hypothetical protein
MRLRERLKPNQSLDENRRDALFKLTFRFKLFAGSVFRLGVDNGTACAPQINCADTTLNGSKALLHKSNSANLQNVNSANARDNNRRRPAA